VRLLYAASVPSIATYVTPQEDPDAERAFSAAGSLYTNVTPFFSPSGQLAKLTVFSAFFLS